MKNQNPPLEQLQPIVNLFNQRKLKKALSESKQLLEIFPNSVILFNIIGSSNAELKLFNEAIETYKKALEIKPDYAEAYFNMGVVLKEKGDTEAAIESYKQALEIKPEYAEAYYNMGNALKDKRDIEAAIESYKQALEIKPDYAEVFNNMGNALKDKGDIKAAIESYKQAVEIKPDYAEAYKNLGNVLKRVTFTKPILGLQKVISSLIDQKKYVKPIDLSQAAISLLKFEPVVKELIERHYAGDIKRLLERLISNLTKAPLLIKLMSVCPLPDLELEAAFTEIRSALLTSVTVKENSPKILRFQSALALQCFTNEYVYSQNDKETMALSVLESEVEQMLLNGEQPRPQYILCLASYKALHLYKWSDLIALNPIIEEVVLRQIIEPKQERLLKSKIPVLQEITNKVSSKVKVQYEENPYPRWVNTELNLNPVPFPVLTKNLKIFDKTINDIKSPKILIAGCGTGQHPIRAASQFKNAKILAVDLSLSSLAYAKRKTKELGFQNIDYMQADILDLVELDRKFDIIQSSGVLHHLDEPIAGWKSLVDCLELGGLMKIGLYSELSRQHIVKIQKEINQLEIGSSDIAMRSFRSDIIYSSKEHHKTIRSVKDFYSLSELRDLLFHVQEHRFTIPQLKDCLSKLDLKFCGFESERIVRNFMLTNIGVDDPYNLDKWDSYEKANPNTFIAMYQFWCQKTI